MSRSLFWLSDEASDEASEEAWAAIEPHLPSNQPGARRVDDRRVISGIIPVPKVGCRWCDCQAEYGPSTTVYNRFSRWSRKGFWVKLLDALAQAGAVKHLHQGAALCLWCTRGAKNAHSASSINNRAKITSAKAILNHISPRLRILFVNRI